jgi:hypothetical protein
VGGRKLGEAPKGRKKIFHRRSANV